MKRPKSSLRLKILISVGAVLLLSLAGSSYSLIRITEVNKTLDAINEISVPLGRLLGQLKVDADILKREMERKLGYSHWKDPHWTAQPIPKWIGDLLDHEVRRSRELIEKSAIDGELKKNWLTWIDDIEEQLAQLEQQSHELYQALRQKDLVEAGKIYPNWIAGLQKWERRIRWGVQESERALRRHFQAAEGQVAALRTGLQAVLVIVICLSLMMVWFGEKALRPLSELTSLVRAIAKRGLRKEDKAKLPEISIRRSDEVSQLAREFRSMATTVLEREKTVEEQSRRLEEQNRLLSDMGYFNQAVLNSIESIILVTDSAGRVTRANPGSARFLGVDDPQKIFGTDFQDWALLREIVPHLPGKDRWIQKALTLNEGFRIDPVTLLDQRIVGGHLVPLKLGEENTGAILVLEDLTEQRDLEERLRLAEHLAAVGRMSAQVAHEIRNPLHSIGLEAELALERSSELQEMALKQSAQSILNAVDRLETITENYLKLSKPSSGKKTQVHLEEVLQNVLATYAPTFEAQGVSVDWSHEKNAQLSFLADSQLLEQVFGNLLRNSLQALAATPTQSPRIQWKMGNTEAGKIWVRIQDNGPGVSGEIRDQLFTAFVTTKAQGTGLGLSFIRRVMEDLGGDVRYIDEPKGACFELIFPVETLAVRTNAQKGDHAKTTLSG